MKICDICGDIIETVMFKLTVGCQINPMSYGDLFGIQDEEDNWKGKHIDNLKKFKALNCDAEICYNCAREVPNFVKLLHKRAQKMKIGERV